MKNIYLVFCCFIAVTIISDNLLAANTFGYQSSTTATRPTVIPSTPTTPSTPSRPSIPPRPPRPPKPPKPPIPPRPPVPPPCPPPRPPRPPRPPYRPGNNYYIIAPSWYPGYIGDRLEPVAKRKDIEFVQTDTKPEIVDQVIMWNQGKDQEVLVIPSQSTVFLSNININDYEPFFANAVAVNPDGTPYKVKNNGYGFPVPGDVRLTLISQNPDDGIIIVEDAKDFPSLQNAPTSGYSLLDIPLEVLDGNLSYVYFYYKIGNYYGVGRVQKQIELQSQGNSFRTKLTLSR